MTTPCVPSLAGLYLLDTGDLKKAVTPKTIAAVMLSLAQTNKENHVLTLTVTSIGYWGSDLVQNLVLDVLSHQLSG